MVDAASRLPDLRAFTFKHFPSPAVSGRHFPSQLSRVYRYTARLSRQSRHMEPKNSCGSENLSLAFSARRFLFLVALVHAANSLCSVKATGDFETFLEKELFHVKHEPVNKPPAGYTPEAQADFVTHLPGFGIPTSNTFAGYEQGFTYYINYNFESSCLQRTVLRMNNVLNNVLIQFRLVSGGGQRG